MNRAWKFIKGIWHDSVWSKVIAAAIVAAASYSFGLVQWCWQKLVSLIEYVGSIYALNPYEIATWVLGLLLLIISALFWKRRPQKEKRITAVEWINGLTIAELSKYGFLFWFPLNRRLKTHSYDERRSFSLGQVSFDHIPEMRELIDRHVVSYTFEGIGQYSVEIDREVYHYLEEVYKQQRVLMDEQTRLVFDKYSALPFDALFPDARQY